MPQAANAQYASSFSTVSCFIKIFYISRVSPFSSDYSSTTFSTKSRNDKSGRHLKTLHPKTVSSKHNIKDFLCYWKQKIKNNLWTSAEAILDIYALQMNLPAWG